MKNFIKFKNVDYIVEDENKNKKFILKNINLEIEKGSFISIVGLNGCGKSTMAKMFSGILLPSRGEVLIDGLNTKDINTTGEIKKKTGMVFQNPENQIIASTVEEEIVFGLENLCVPPEKMEMKIKEALNFVDMNGFEKKTTFSLSGGQKQRLNIASVIAMKPEIIILDEPTSMLDPYARESILKLLIKLNKELKTTIILITHFMQEAIFSEKVIIMDNGEIKTFDFPKAVFSKEKFSQYVFPMQSATLLLFLKKLGYNICIDSFKTSECAKEIIKLLES